MSDHRPVLVIHGGAGRSRRARPIPARRATTRPSPESSWRRSGLPRRRRSALDAVSVAVDLLEECPLFNAGHGAVFTSAETHELDAAIMDGATLRAGAVAGVSRVRRPGRAAAR